MLILDSGDLDEPKRSELEAHLRECTLCAARIAKLRGMVSCIEGSLAQPEVGPDITGQVMSRILPEPRPARRFVWFFAAGAAVAACLLLLVLSRSGIAPPAAKKQAIERVVRNRTPLRTVHRPALKRPDTVAPQAPDRVVKHRRPASPKRMAHLRHVRPPRRTRPQTAAVPDVDFRVELHIEANASRIVVAAGGDRPVAEIPLRNEVIPIRPETGASEIERPPLKTEVSVNQAALILSQM